jgi:hypothetical protein
MQQPISEGHVFARAFQNSTEIMALLAYCDYGPMWDEIIERWRKLHNEELHNSYASENIIRILKTRRIRWTGHAAYMGKGMHKQFHGETRRKDTTKNIYT